MSVLSLTSLHDLARSSNTMLVFVAASKIFPGNISTYVNLYFEKPYVYLY